MTAPHAPSLIPVDRIPPIERQRSLEVLLSRTGAGDHEAFAEVYRRLSARVFSTVSLLACTPAEADAMVVEVFVQVWRTAATYDPQAGRGTPWVMTIARERALRRVRDRAHAPSPDRG